MLLALAMGTASIRLARQPRVARSAKERHSELKNAFVAGALGVFLLIWSYHGLQLDDVVIFDKETAEEAKQLKSGQFDQSALDALLKRGCAIRSGPCVLNLSSKTPSVLLQGLLGSWILVNALRTGVRRRRDFSYRPDTSPEEQK
ncbi:hypothetical protein [Dongia sp.]|uniref:hypothetical protein n=1 Tax=Dongia sp. TaxID=1977262 RepID=UPI00374FF79A